MQQHGEYSIQRHGQILLVDARGPWNEELIATYKAEMLAIIRNMSPHPWANIIVVHGTGIMTPDAENEMLGLVKLRKSLGLTCTAMVTGDSEVPCIVKAQFERVYSEAGINYQFFDLLDDAFDWLNHLGFEGLVG